MTVVRQKMSIEQLLGRFALMKGHKNLMPTST
jgi:hypothetical protein